MTSDDSIRQSQKDGTVEISAFFEFIRDGWRSLMMIRYNKYVNKFSKDMPNADEFFKYA